MTPFGTDSITEQIRLGFSALGLSTHEETIPRYSAYLDLLWDWNGAFRLTGEGSKMGLVENQLLDCLALHPFVNAECPLVDIGSGPGFPGIVLKVLYPNKEIWLVEANRHRANFLKETQRRLGLRQLFVWEGRGEELRAEKSAHERFGESVAKAFGNIRKFLEISQPVLVPGGKALAMVGPLQVRKILTHEVWEPYSTPIVHRVVVPFRKEPRALVQFFKQTRIT